MSAAERPEPPWEVRVASLALWTVGSLFAVSGLLTALSREEQVAELRRTVSTLTDAEIEQSVNLGTAISVVFAVAVAALAMISAVNALRGRRWARVSGTVVAGLTAASAVLKISAGGPAVALNLAVLIASLTAVVLLFRRPATRYLTSP